MYVVGIDEVGRGPLAGPVVAACVCLNSQDLPSMLKDSKKLSPNGREKLDRIIRQQALSFGIGVVFSDEIDRINILQATFKAMRSALDQVVSKLDIDLALIDGDKIIPKIDNIAQKAIIKGDAIEPSIMAASIIAKVYRDSLMIEYDAQFPAYGFAKHKGYGTKDHLAAINKYGPCSIHRKTFAPLKYL